MKGHEIILNDYLNLIKRESISSVLDAGSGRTSLSIIANSFQNMSIDAVVYPGDLRKINSVREITDNNKNLRLIKKDICCDIFTNEYDLIIAHLLLGEAAKFGNTFENLLEKVITMKYKYLIIIDYLEDPAINENYIIYLCEKYNLTVVYRSYFTNPEPHVWEDFVGIHNFGYLIKRS